MSIYTRTGDLGETSLFGGKRVPKYDDIVDLCGLIDELNSAIGLIVSMTTAIFVQDFLREIQRDLFSMSSFFSGSEINLLPLTKRVSEMEAQIDKMDDTLRPLRRFILPGGTPLAAYIHVARSVTRRVERKAVFVFKNDTDHPEIDKKKMEKMVQYLNRLSDVLFVLARFVNNEEKVTEIEWAGSKEK